MTQADLDPDEAVNLAARWLLNERDPLTGRAIVPEIKTRFGITTAQACEAARIAQELRRLNSGGRTHA